MGRYQTALVDHIRRWHEALNTMHSAFVSVSLSAAGDDPHEHAEADDDRPEDAAGCGSSPDRTLHAAGALRFTQYDFFKRWAMRLIALQRKQKVDTSIDTEYTDWDAVRRFTEEFLATLPSGGGT